MTSNNCLVSIIIPVYNVSAYVERCIKSVMNQTYSDIECIIVDDATPDDSINKCEQMIAVYDGPIRFIILHHQRNRGLSAARNTGTEAATGEYLYYLDSDDAITRDCIETLLKPMIEDCTIDIVQGNHLDEKDGEKICMHKRTSPIYISTNIDVYNNTYKSYHIICSAWNKLIKRSFVEQFQLFFKEGLLHEDKHWMFYVQKHLKKMYISQDITYIYHIRPHSIMTGGYSVAEGNSYLYIFNDFLNHLTPEREKIELCGNFSLFGRIYSRYYKDIPAYSDLHSHYRKRAWRYGCWKVYILLSILSIVRRFANPLIIKKQFRTIQHSVAKLFYGNK